MKRSIILIWKGYNWTMFSIDVMSGLDSDLPNLIPVSREGEDYEFRFLAIGNGKPIYQQI